MSGGPRWPPPPFPSNRTWIAAEARFDEAKEITVHIPEQLDDGRLEVFNSRVSGDPQARRIAAGIIALTRISFPAIE